MELAGGVFDARTGALVRLGDVVVEDLRLDVWRAPLDNDRDLAWEPLEPAWRAVGLHRVQHRVDAVEVGDDALVVRTRTAPAGTDLGLEAVFRWSGLDEVLRLEVAVVPVGAWTVPLPRLGLRMALPQRLERVEWFGLGPGESYADSRRAARVGRFRASVDELQTPYVFPQENGNRTGTRTLWVRSPEGPGLRVDGDEPFSFTARRWTSEALDRARHTAELEPGERVWLNLDHAQHGLGSASCGPGVLPAHQLRAEPAAWVLELSTTG